MRYVAGNVYVADGNNNRIRRIAPDSTTTLAGNGTPGSDDGTGGADGNAEFRDPGGVGVDGAGNIYVADTWNYSIRRIAPNGTTSTRIFSVRCFSQRASWLTMGVIYIDYQGGRIFMPSPVRARRSWLAPAFAATLMDHVAWRTPDGSLVDGAGKLA